MNTSLADLATNRFENAAILTWGLGYWVTIAVEPDLLANFGTTVSVIFLFGMGAVVLGNLILDSRVLWALIGAFMTWGIASSWVLSTEWTVPYSPAAAALSMTAVNAITAVLAFAKALRVPDAGATDRRRPVDDGA